MNKYLSGSLIALYFLYFIASLSVVRLHNMLTREYLSVTLEKKLAGEAPAPFQHRMLVPWIIKATQSIFPFSLKVVSSLVRIVITFCLMLAMYKWLEIFFPESIAKLAPILLVMILPWSFDFDYQDDFMSILVFTVCLMALWQKNWTLYFTFFTLGVINRETAVFLIFPFIFAMWPEIPKKKFFLMLLGQIGLVIGIKLLYANLYPASEMIRDKLAANVLDKGALFFFRPGENLEVILTTWQRLENYVQTLQGASRLDFRMFWQMSGFIWVLAIFGYKKAHPFLQRVSWVTPIFISAMFLVGLLSETRIFYELIPIFLPLALYPLVPTKA